MCVSSGGEGQTAAPSGGGKGLCKCSIQSLAAENTPTRQRERAAVGGWFEQLVERKIAEGNSPSSLPGLPGQE